MKNNSAVGLILVCTLYMPLSAWATSLNIIGGQLVGATDVDVNGSLYDVSFVDGTCEDVFEGCDSVSDFAFSSQSDALAASQSLLDQVFIDGVEGNFNSNPFLISGITGTWAYINTNYFVGGSILRGAYAYFDDNFIYDSTNLYQQTPWDDNSVISSWGVDVQTWAVWSKSSSSPTVVPAPPVIWLLGIGLVGLISANRFKKA